MNKITDSCQFFVMLALAVLSASQAYGQTYAVHWSGSYTTSDALLNLGKSIPIENGEIWPYSADIPKSPVSNYKPELPSAVFYGALETQTSIKTSLPLQARIIHSPEDEDRLILRAVDDQGEPPRVILRGMLFWKLNESEAVLDGHVPLKAFQSFSTEIAFIRGDVEMRYAVQNKGKWYLSEAVWGPQPEQRAVSPKALLSIRQWIPVGRNGPWMNLR